MQVRLWQCLRFKVARFYGLFEIRVVKYLLAITFIGLQRRVSTFKFMVLKSQESSIGLKNVANILTLLVMTHRCAKTAGRHPALDFLHEENL